MFALCAATLHAVKPFVVRVVDDETGRGVPLVELRALNHITFVTDSAGIAAMDDVVLNGRRVMFEVTSHGYEYQGEGVRRQASSDADVDRGWQAGIKDPSHEHRGTVVSLQVEAFIKTASRRGFQVPIREPL